MLSKEYTLRYNPSIYSIYAVILLISFTFSLTFLQYTDFLNSYIKKNKSSQPPSNVIDDLLKNKKISNYTRKDDNSNINNTESRKTFDKIKNLKNRKNHEIFHKNKKQEEVDDSKQKDRTDNESNQEEESSFKREKDRYKAKFERKNKRSKIEDVFKSKRRNKKESETRNEYVSKNENEVESELPSEPIFQNGRTFDRLYSKTHSSPFYPKEFPKLEADTEKMEAVKEAFMHAWSNYDHYCFGHDTFHPKTLHCEDRNLKGGLTIIDSISTIIIMGLEEPYRKVRNFVKNQFAPHGSWSLFEFNIRYLGGLLSAYSLSHDQVFKKAAVGLGDAVNEIMEQTGGFFDQSFKLKTINQLNYEYSASGSKSSYSVLAECGTFQLEFFKLAEITGDDKYIKSATNVWKKLWRKNKNGLISSHIGAGEDSYYEYVIKSYLLTGGVGKEILRRHLLLMKDIKSQLVFKSINHGLVGIGQKSNAQHPDSEVEHLATFAAGMIAIGSVKENGNHEEDLKLASDLATTYAKTYAHFKSGIMPEHVRFNVDDENNKEDIELTVDGYILRPETVESIFYLYRFTGDQKYRDYNWQIFKAINRSCRVENGFTSISSLLKDPKDVYHHDEMESFFLAETLKYLYLTFTDSSLISPVEWVFNTEAHPLHMWNQKTIEKFSNEIDIQISKSLNRTKIKNIPKLEKKIKNED